MGSIDSKTKKQYQTFKNAMVSNLVNNGIINSGSSEIKRKQSIQLNYDPWRVSYTKNDLEKVNISDEIHKLFKTFYDSLLSNINYKSYQNECKRQLSMDLDTTYLSTSFSVDSIISDTDDYDFNLSTSLKRTNINYPKLTFDDDNDDGLKTITKSTIKPKYKLRNIRYSYMTRLITHNIWKQSEKETYDKLNNPLEKMSKNLSYNSIIIFDWDDTLFCTSYITPDFNIRKIKSNDIEGLKSLENVVLKILMYYKDKGDVFIITNSSPDWLNYSAKTFFPQVYDILKDLRVISAREEFELKFPEDSRQWKIKTFMKLRNLYQDKLTNILCFGDNEIEHESAFILGQKFKEAYVKTIKFKKAPLLNELTKQLKRVLKSKEMIFETAKNLQIELTKRNSK